MRDISNIIKGFFELEKQRQRQEWERVRWHATHVVQFSGLFNKKTIKPTDLRLFEWEKPKPSEKKQLTEKQESDLQKWREAADNLHLEEMKKKQKGDG